MDISVIVVTYNQAATIARTLDSILAQETDAEFEIVIGDDCSTDNTSQICRDYAQRFPDRIIYLRREKNMGVVANYFDCIARARGRYLADCAGDDQWVDVSKLQEQYEILEDYPYVSMVATDWLCRDTETGELSRAANAPEISKFTIFPKRGLLHLLASQTWTLHLCTALYRKEIIDRLNSEAPQLFSNPELRCEDPQIILGMAAEGAIALLPRISLHYSVGHDSISNPAGFARKFDYSLAAFDQTLELQQYFDISDPAVSDANNRRASYLISLAFRSGSTESYRKLVDFFKRHKFSKSRKDRFKILLLRLRSL